jgi:hypothetical protein
MTKLRNSYGYIWLGRCVESCWKMGRYSPMYYTAMFSLWMTGCDVHGLSPNSVFRTVSQCCSLQVTEVTNIIHKCEHSVNRLEELLPNLIYINPFKTDKSKSKVKVILRPTVSRPVFLSVKPIWETRFLLLSDSCGYFEVGRPLWREDRCLAHISTGHSQRRHSRVQVPLVSYLTVSDLRPPPQSAGPVPYIFNPPVAGWPRYTPSTGFPFRRLLLLAGWRSHQ